MGPQRPLLATVKRRKSTWSWHVKRHNFSETRGHIDSKRSRHLYQGSLKEDSNICFLACLLLFRYFQRRWERDYYFPKIYRSNAWQKKNKNEEKSPCSSYVRLSFCSLISSHELQKWISSNAKNSALVNSSSVLLWFWNTFWTWLFFVCLFVCLLAGMLAFFSRYFKRWWER